MSSGAGWLWGRREIRKSVHQTLGQLGDDPSAIVAYLASQGVRGRRRSGPDCVIARYLHSLVGVEPGVGQVFVSRSSVQLARPGLRPAITVRLPQPLRSFIEEFDAGRYPELVDIATTSDRRQAGYSG